MHGALDADVRYKNADFAEPRWVEGMKFAVPAFTDAEYQAVKGAGFLISCVQNQELRQGYAGQMLDEVRHTQLETTLRRYYLKERRESRPRIARHKHMSRTTSAAIFKGTHCRSDRAESPGGCGHLVVFADAAGSRSREERIRRPPQPR